MAASKAYNEHKDNDGRATERTNGPVTAIAPAMEMSECDTPSRMGYLKTRHRHRAAIHPFPAPTPGGQHDKTTTTTTTTTATTLWLDEVPPMHTRTHALSPCMRYAHCLPNVRWERLKLPRQLAHAELVLSSLCKQRLEFREHVGIAMRQLLSARQPW